MNQIPVTFMPGDRVYFICGQKIVSSKVERVTIELRHHHQDVSTKHIQCIVHDNEGEPLVLNEDHLWRTPEDLLAYMQGTVIVNTSA